ncbi:MAG: fasciclin domain-containing protein [Akkermansiaceae bacterium]|nr:fasciclin domain-containing protein [Armatimonadota bacterium]
MRNIFVFAGIAAAAALFAPSAQAADVVEIAMSDPQFSTLVKAVKAAGLVDALKTTQNITVFAPTNKAFAKLPKATLAMLLKPENKAKLASLLKYHVVAKKVMAADVVAMSGPADVPSLAGPTIRVGVNPPMVNNAKIIKTDIAADNGVIHVIDTVIMPSGNKTNGKMAPKMGNKMAPKMDKM